MSDHTTAVAGMGTLTTFPELGTDRNNLKMSDNTISGNAGAYHINRLEYGRS